MTRALPIERWDPDRMDFDVLAGRCAVDIFLKTRTGVPDTETAEIIRSFRETPEAAEFYGRVALVLRMLTVDSLYGGGRVPPRMRIRLVSSAYSRLEHRCRDLLPRTISELRKAVESDEWNLAFRLLNSI